MMPKTPDEIKKGMECCATVKVGGVCPFDCPLQPLCESGDDGAVQREILALIQQLESKLECSQMTIDGLTATLLKCDAIIKQLEAERDALIKEIETFQHPCDCCKHAEKEASKKPCDHCKQIFKGRKSQFEWRGVQKEE